MSVRWDRKSVPKITDWHHGACRVMTNGDREGRIFLSHPHTYNGFLSCSPLNKNEGKDQESIQLSTTPDTEYQWESDNVTIRHHKRYPRGQPFPSTQQVITRHQQTDMHESITKQDRNNINNLQKKWPSLF